MSADGRRVVFVRADDTSSTDVFVADVGGDARRLTDVNPWLRRQPLGEVREVRWTSFDGMQIEGMLVLPVGYEDGRRCPTVVSLHGGFSLWGRGLYLHCEHWAQHLAQRGYAVLLPNPRGSAGRGSEFMRVDPWGEPDGKDVLAGVDLLIELGIADPERLGVGGASYGGYLTNWLVAHTDRFRAAVSVCGVANWSSFQSTSDISDLFGFDPDSAWEHSPLRMIEDVRTPTLILSGADDQRVPPSQGQELHAALELRGIETELMLYPREGHLIVEREHQIDLLQRVTAWFDRHLGGIGSYSDDTPGEAAGVHTMSSVQGRATKEVDKMESQEERSDLRPRFIVSLAEWVAAGPITSRVLLVMSRTNEPEVRLQDTGLNGPTLFAVGVDQLVAGQDVVIDSSTLGWPLKSLRDLPRGEWFVQAYVKVYVEYRRSDGHTLWALDQWEGHEFARSPGVLYSDVVQGEFDPARTVRQPSP
jgi:dienelactone hydrolase